MRKFSNFTANVVSSTMGMDDNASSAWMQKYVELASRTEINAYLRAEAHWGASLEEEQDAVASYLGWSEPMRERFPFSKVILSDYETAIALVTRILNPD